MHFDKLLVPLGALWGHFWRWCGAARQPGARPIQADQWVTTFFMIFNTFWIPFRVDLGIQNRLKMESKVECEFGLVFVGSILESFWGASWHVFGILFEAFFRTRFWSQKGPRLIQPE